MYYKEWIKTRWFYLVAALTLLGFSAYNLLNLSRVIEIKGAEHLWEVAITRDAIFIQNITYLPLLIAVAAAITQFVPEMIQKRLKLTMHLPVSYVSSMFSMLMYGLGALTLLFTVNLAVLYAGVAHFFTTEIVKHIMLTAVEWHLAALIAYPLTAWVVLEPTWKVRVADIFISAAIMRYFFAESQPEAYNKWLLPMVLLVLIFTLLPILSATRFKEGVE